MGAGSLLMVVGIFGIPCVLGAAGRKLVIPGAWGVVLVHVVRDFRRA